MLEDTSYEIVRFPMGGVGENGVYTIPDGVSSIGEEAFVNSMYLTKVVIPGYVSVIGESAFEGLETLQEVEFTGVANDTPLTIRTRAFYGCEGFTSLTLPGNLLTLEAYAFGNTVNLTSVRVESAGQPDETGVYTLDFANGAFSTTGSRTYVTSLTLGANVPVLSVSGVFGGTVVNIDVTGNPNYHTDEYGVLYNGNVTEILYYPNRIGAYVIPDTVTTIGAEVFRDRDQLTSVTIGANVSAIGDYAFYDCSYLASVNFAVGMQENGLTIGDYAFGRCGRLTSISLPEGTTSLGEGAFYSSALRTIHIPSTVTYMGENSGTGSYSFDVFSACSELTAVEVAENNTAYADIDGILYVKSVIDPTAETPEYYISALAFCPRRNSGADGVVDIPSTVRAIWDGAFEMNNGVKTIIFGGGEGLEPIMKPGTEEGTEEVAVEVSLSVGSGVFRNCVTLESVVFPEGLTTIQTQMFFGCDALREVFIPNTVTSIQSSAFSGCPLLSDIRFGEGGTDPLAIGEEDDVSGAFASCQGLTEISLPERTTLIGGSAFQGCIGLTSVYIPSTVTTIAGNAFRNVPLEELVFAEGSQLRTIGEEAFMGIRVKNLVLPEGLSTIGESAFENADLGGSEENGYTFTIPASVSEIGNGAFYKTKVRNVVFGENSLLTALPQNMFYYAVNLETVTFNGFAEDAEGNPPEVTFGTSVFMGCTALESIDIPANVTEIGTNCFKYCVSLSSVTFDTLTDEESGTEYSMLDYVRNSAFAGTGISEFVFPESSAASITLGSGIFTACPNLTSITLSGQVTNISGAFRDCLRLETIVISDTNQNFAEEGGVIYNLQGNTVQYVYAPQAPAEGVEAGVTVDASGNAVISGVENIGNYAFANRTDITSVYISADVQTIGTYAFSGCTNLKTVVFEAGSPLQSIGSSAFADCTSLESIALPTTENFKSLPSSIFNGCSSLTSVTLPTNLTAINGSAFRYCSSLQSISIPATVTSFGTYVFADCSNLSEVNFNGNTSIRSLGNYMFYNCTALETVTLPTSLTFLGTYTFRGSGLTSIDLTELTGLTCFGTRATSCSATSSVYLFADCANLAEVKLPSTLTKFGGYIFQNCTSLTSFDLTGLTQIGRNCFQNTGLTSVAVPSSVNTDIGNYAFADCAALSSVTIAEGVTGVGTNTFQNCTQIAEMHLPSTVDTIGNYAFNGCTSLVSINIPAAVSKLGTYVFQNCTSLAEVTFDEGSALTQFGNYCFDGCISLTSIDLPETVTFLGQYTFRGCGLVEIDLSALTGLTRIASTATTTSVTSNIYTFANCKSLTRVVLPEGLTLIAGYVFDGCENLSSINLDNVEKFGNRVFTGTALTSVNLSVNLSSMGYLVFAGCPYLESVNVPSNCVAFSSEDGVLYNADGEIVCFPAGKEVEGGVLTLEEGVGVGDSAFAGCNQIEEVIIPEGITEIGQYAFYDSGIKRITIPASVTHLRTYAFAYSDISEIVIPATVTNIYSHLFDGSALQTATVEATAALASSTAQYLFANCELLTSVTFAEGTESIPSYAFLNCPALESIALPSTVTTIGGSAFSGSGLKTFTIGDGAENVVGGNVEWIGSSAFAGTRLVSVRFEIPELKASATNLSTTYTASLFSGCTELTTVTFSEGMTILGDDLFLNCPALTTVYVIGTDGAVRGEQGVVTLPESLTEIGDSTFEGSGIVSIRVPDSVATMGSYVFRYCTALTNAELPAGMPLIGSGLFYGCSELETVVLPDVVVQIGGNAFNGCTSIGKLVIPSTVAEVLANAFSGWTAEQQLAVEISGQEAAVWWNDSWSEGCNAAISYNYTGEESSAY